jgi:heptosyltransferase-2
MALHDKRSSKILLRSPNWVGDAVMATPVLRALKRSQPACRIHVLAKRWVAPVWENNPDVEQIKYLDGPHSSWFSCVRGLRREKYDLTIILPNSFSSAWLAFWSGSRKRVGYVADHRAWLLTTQVSWIGHERNWPRPQTYLNVAKAAGVDMDMAGEINFFLKATGEELARADVLLNVPEKKKLIGLAPGSVAVSRRWPAARYAQLADELARQGYAVVLVGSGADAAVAQAVAAHTQSKPPVLAGKTNLREAMAVIRRMALLVSNDSGSMHLAYAQGVPVLVLQGAADPNVTGPFGANSRIVRAPGIACAPCVRNECPRGLECMTAISLEQVSSAIGQMLAESRD